MPEPGGRASQAGAVPVASSEARARVLTACHVGPLGYADGLALQESMVKARAEGETGDWLLFPDHPPVLTVGRGAAGGNILADHATLARLGVPVFEVARGGDVTWHGPGQLVGYPICGLAGEGRDLHRFLRAIERSLLTALAEFSIEGEVVSGRTGVWVNGEKIASIGIAVRRWVSYHGFALNVAPDLGYFDLINPCGFRGIRMTSMSRLLGANCPSLDQVREVAARSVASELGYKEWCWAPWTGPRTGEGPAGPDAERVSSAGVERAA